MPDRFPPVTHVTPTPDRWGRVASVFDEAFALDAAARTAFLERECDGDPALRVQVERMLQAADAPEAFLDASEIQSPVDAGVDGSAQEDRPDEVTSPALVPETAVPLRTAAPGTPPRWLIGAAVAISLAALAGATALAWQARVARARASSAERQLGGARALGRSVLDGYLDAIGSAATPTPSRQRFVREGLSHLDQLARGADDRTSRLELAEAYRRFAELQVDARNGALADTAGAIVSMRKAVAMLDPLMTADSSDAATRRALTGMLRTLGILLRQGRDLSQARSVLERVVLLVGTPSATEARDPAVALSLQQQHQGLGQVLFAIGDTAAARREFNTALAALDGIPDGARTTAPVREAYATTLQHVADLTVAAGQPAAAAQVVTRVVALRRALLAGKPASREHQRALGFAYEREGEILSSLGRYADATRSYRSALAMAETLLRGDRTDARSRADAARASARLGDAASLAGDVETAIQHFSASLALQRQGGGTDTITADVRVATIDAQARLARSHARLQQTAEALAVLARTESIMDATPLDSSDVATRSAFGETYVSLAETYLTLRGQGVADARSAGICRKAGRMFDRAEAVLADLLTRERASARDSSRLIASRSLRTSARAQCPAG